MRTTSAGGRGRCRSFSAFMACALLIPAWHRAQAQSEPPAEPILRIDTGMHNAPILRIGVDAANRFLVTAAADKTVRVWELPSGRLQRVLRVPIGTANEGDLYAVALSPDGRSIAAAGWTGLEWERTNCIYVFDRESGRLVHRPCGVPEFMGHLAYSPDGKYLAAALARTGGVRVFSTDTYAAVGEDHDYGDHCYSADFDHGGRLVTASYDGFIRLYAAADGGGALRLLVKRGVAGGQRPSSARFSPDGSRVAIGFNDSNSVTVLRADDLSPLYEPDHNGISNGNLFSVAWSANGRTLYAGGTAVDLGGRKFMRAWADGAGGGYRDIAVDASNTIMHILPRRAGGVLYGAADPAFGAIDEHDRQVLFAGAPIADLRSLRSLLVSPDGTGIGFDYQYSGQSPARFSIVERKLDTAPAGGVIWPPAETTDDGLRISDWVGGYTPKLNGVALPLAPYETSFSVALAPDRNSFLLGAEFFLRLFDRSGVERWRNPDGGLTWAVNISADGKLAVAAHADGTIRWYRMSDGRELLAFFPRADRRGWVLWSPSGYYDAAPGAEHLFGWHVNNGRSAAADFFPAGQFRATHYRPDVIARMLETGDERRALQLANEAAGRPQQQASIAQQLPPVVEILSPADDSDVTSSDVTARFRVATPSGEPVTGVKVLLNGRPVGPRQLPQSGADAGAVRELHVGVPEGESTIAIVAENRFTSSVPATTRVKWRAAPASRPAAGLIKPKLYILAVGISQYADKQYDLMLADKDARDFTDAMLAQKDLLYREVVVKLLTNEKATKDEVLDGLDWIRQQTTNNDVGMVFFAGHGVNDQNNYYYFAPYNVDPARLLRTGVAFSDIKNTVSAIAGKALFFVDTCHSGNSIGLATRRGVLDINRVINELSSAENGVVVFSASTGSESSYELDEWRNGAFTKALVEGLNGAAAIGDSGRITYNMLNLYVSERVKDLTKGQQHPTMISPATVPDFPVAVKR